MGQIVGFKARFSSPAQAREEMKRLEAVSNSIEAHFERHQVLGALEAIPNLDADKTYRRPLALPVVTG